MLTTLDCTGFGSQAAQGAVPVRTQIQPPAADPAEPYSGLQSQGVSNLTPKCRDTVRRQVSLCHTPNDAACNVAIGLSAPLQRTAADLLWGHHHFQHWLVHGIDVFCQLLFCLGACLQPGYEGRDLLRAIPAPLLPLWSFHIQRTSAQQPASAHDHNL